jgi:hypothetical protein
MERPRESKDLEIERVYEPNDDAIRHAFAILLDSAGERRDTAA